jgi:protein disulfide-isomerase
MRSILYPLLSLATFASTFAAETPAAQATAKKDDWDEKTPDTTFNGETVPPMIELGPNTIDTEIGKGNWYEERHEYPRRRKC